MRALRNSCGRETALHLERVGRLPHELGDLEHDVEARPFVSWLDRADERAHDTVKPAIALVVADVRHRANEPADTVLGRRAKARPREQDGGAVVGLQYAAVAFYVLPVR